MRFRMGVRAYVCLPFVSVCACVRVSVSVCSFVCEGVCMCESA